MPFYLNGAMIYGSYECKCGASGDFSDMEGDVLVDDSFTLFSFECPECGRELDLNEDEEDDE